MDELTVIIIGAGTKGALYAEKELTHAYTFSQEPFKLFSFVDSNPKNLSKACKRWNTKGFDSIQEAFQCKPDIVTIAVPEKEHYEVLRGIAKEEYKPRLVFTEKPFCASYDEAKEIADIYKEKGIELSINFSRRFIPEYQMLVDLECHTMTGYYTKGLHNLCHLVDLSIMFGVDKLTPILVQRDYLNIFEVDLFSDLTKISLLDHGSRIRYIPISLRKDYPQDRILNYSKESFLYIDLSKAMLFAAANIYEHLFYNEPLLSTVENALQVMKECEKWQK